MNFVNKYKEHLQPTWTCYSRASHKTSELFQKLPFGRDVVLLWSNKTNRLNLTTGDNDSPGVNPVIKSYICVLK